MNKEIMSIYIFQNGNIAVFNVEGKQIPELQTNILSDMKDKGYNIDNAIMYK